MLRRAAIVLFLLIVSAGALVGARHLGVNLPWDAATIEPEAPSAAQSNRREETAPPATPEASAPAAEPVIEETQAALERPDAEQPKPAEGGVTIDISRISADGASVFAGRAAPDSYVTVIEDGRRAGTAKADANGEWSLFTEHRFASIDPHLTYEVSRTPPAPEAKTDMAEAQTEAQPPSQPQAQIEPEPAAAEAEAAVPAEPALPPTTSAAEDVMRKFENLVEAAREEAKQNETAANDGTAANDAGLDRATASSSEPAEEPAATASAAAPEDAHEAGATASDTDAAAEGETAADHGSAEIASRTEPEPSAHTEARIAAAGDMSEHSRTAQESTSAAARTDVIPVPIMFVYNEATLTPEGRRAAALLLEYLTLKKLDAVELTGHADERGSDAYNYELSRERLDAVAVLLKDGGYAGTLKLTPKGKTEPYMGVDRSAYRGEALYQLDRRVELRLQR